LEKFFPKNIFFSKNFLQKNIFQKKNLPEKILRNFFLPTLVEVSSSVLKLEEYEIFLLQLVEIG